MSTASQDFRDGAASGAEAIAYRARILDSFGIPLTVKVLDDLARTVVHDMGGRVLPIGPYVNEGTPEVRDPVVAESIHRAHRRFQEKP